jgi:hypothetical protein
MANVPNPRGCALPLRDPAGNVLPLLGEQLASRGTRRWVKNSIRQFCSSSTNSAVGPLQY